MLTDPIDNLDRDGVKQKIADTLDGVSASDISLSLSSSNRKITVNILTLSDETAANTMRSLRSYTPDVMSTILGGVQVESIEPPTLAASVGGTSPGSADRSGMIGAAVAVVFGLPVVVWITWRVCRIMRSNTRFTVQAKAGIPEVTYLGNGLKGGTSSRQQLAVAHSGLGPVVRDFESLSVDATKENSVTNNPFFMDDADDPNLRL